MPRVSVLILNSTYSPFLGKAIQSVLDQTFQDFEIIVVDDSSTDKTREVVNGFKDVRIRYIRQENPGVSAAQNAGIKASSGEYITGMMTYDLYLPENLKVKVKVLDSRPDLGLVCSDAYIFNHHTGAVLYKLWHDPKGPYYPWLDPVKATRQPLKELLRMGCFITPPTAMVRRQVFEAVGYYDESLPSHEDLDMYIRVVQHFSIEVIDLPLLKLRQRRTDLSKIPENAYCGAVAVSNKLIRCCSLSKEELKLLKERMIPQHYWYWRQAFFGGREAAARKALTASIRLDPWKIKPYVYFVLSFLGTRNFLALRNWKKKLSRRSVQRKPSGGTGSIGS